MISRTRAALGLGCAQYAVIDLPAISWRLADIRPEWCPEPMFQIYAIGLLAIYVFAVDRFIRGQRPLWTAAILYLCLTQFNDWGVAATDSVSVTTTLIGPLLLTWTLCHTVGGLVRMTAARCERISIDAMCGVFAAMMAMAAYSKFQISGPDWADGQTHAMMVFERHLHAPAPLRWLRSSLAQSPEACTMGAQAVWLTEALAPLFIWKGSRRLYAWMVLLMFTSLGLSICVWEVPWVIIPLALAYPDKT